MYNTVICGKPKNVPRGIQVLQWYYQQFEQKYGKKAPLTDTQGKLHAYLGIAVDLLY